MVQKEELQNINKKITMDCIMKLHKTRSNRVKLNKLVLKRNIRSLVKERKLLLPEEHFFWINGLLAEGIISYGQFDKDPYAYQELTKFYDYFLLKSRMRIKCFYLPDQIIHANVLLKLVKDGKNKYEKLIHDAAEYIKKESSQDPNLLIHYRGKNFDFYIDSLGMLIGFCLNYGVFYQDYAMISIGLAQMDFTLQHCMNQEMRLPYHICKNKNNEVAGPWSWGRGIGWYMIGLTEILLNIKENHEKYPVYLRAYQDSLKSIFTTQDQNGYLYNDIILKDHIDTSTTAMIGYCLGVGIEKGFVNRMDYESLFIKSINALHKSTEQNGKVNDSSGECKGVNQYSTEYGNFFAQGYTIKSNIQYMKLF